MFVAARESFAIANAKRWRNPYITDGLVAMWDGIWNAGPGVHDASATTWADLSPNHYDLTVNITSGNYWVADALHVTHGAVVPAYRETGISGICTIEGVFANTRISNMASVLVIPPNREIVVSQQSGVWRYALCYRRPCGVGTDNAYAPSQYSGKRMHIAGTFASSAAETLSAGYINGINVGLQGTVWGANASTYPVSVGARTAWNGVTGTIHSLRLHSRALTAAEIAANYAIDKARFNLP